MRTHYLMLSKERENTLRRNIEGFENIISNLKLLPLQIIDLNEELEYTYGLAVMAMQNYVAMTCVDCHIIYSDLRKLNIKQLKYSDLDKPYIKLKEFSDNLHKAVEKIPNSNYTKPELIHALANSFRHRDDLEAYYYKMNNPPTDDNKKKDVPYHGNTSSVLNEYNLLLPYFPEDETCLPYPVTKGLELLDENINLQKIADDLCEWGMYSKENVKD